MFGLVRNALAIVGAVVVYKKWIEKPLDEWYKENFGTKEE